MNQQDAYPSRSQLVNPGIARAFLNNNQPVAKKLNMIQKLWSVPIPSSGEEGNYPDLFMGKDELPDAIKERIADELKNCSFKENECYRAGILDFIIRNNNSLDEANEEAKIHGELFYAIAVFAGKDFLIGNPSGTLKGDVLPSGESILPEDEIDSYDQMLCDGTMTPDQFFENITKLFE